MSILEIKNVTQRFSGLKALSKIDIEVQEGEILGIIGPNGAGKTTLFNIISGFQKPTEGEIIYLGENITGTRPDLICRKGVTRSFQGTSLCPTLSCLANLVVAHHLYKEFSFWGAMLYTKSYLTREREIVEKSMTVLEKLNLADKANDQANSIPYGNQKMLGVAMALASNPRVLLLDEPVAGMNLQESMAMTEEIRRIRGELGKTVVLVEHNMKVVMGVCDRVVVIQHGEKIAQGIPDYVKNDPKVIEAYLGTEE